MSGIAGVFYRDGQPVERALLDRISARLAHRGADGYGVWHAGPVGLVHRLFCTTPESRYEQQPLSAARSAGAIVLTADARIDNRAELAGPLALADTPDQPDSAFILAAYEKWGEACPEHLIGDFAFAIWDTPRQQLFCARDALGIKSFFYFESPRLFAFASEIKGLLCLSEVPQRLNEPQIARFLTRPYTDPQPTLYESIRRVRPGECVIVTPGETRSRLYWTLDLNHELRLPSDDDYAAAFRERFAEAVRCRLRSLTPAATMLSGGLDSSSITCMARQLLNGQPLHTFSVVFDEAPESDESGYMQASLDGGGLTPHFIKGDRQTPLFDIDHVLWHLEEPFQHLGVYIQWLTFAAVQAQGLRLFLTGNGGDAIVSYGLFRLAELTRSGRWGLLRQELHDLAAANGHDLSWQARFWWEYGGRPLVPVWARQIRRAVRRRQPGQEPNIFINPEFARRIEKVPVPKSPRTVREDHWQVLAMAIAVADTYDRVAPAWQTEPRHPMLDRRLAEFCFALPSEQKLHQGQSRRIFRRAMRGVLPEAVRGRSSKTTPAYSLVKAILRTDRERLDDCLLANTERLRPYVNIPVVQHEYRQLRALSTPDLSVWARLNELVRVALLALWLRTDLDTDKPATATRPRN